MGQAASFTSGAGAGSRGLRVPATSMARCRTSRMDIDSGPPISKALLGGGFLLEGVCSECRDVTDEDRGQRWLPKLVMGTKGRARAKPRKRLSETSPGP